MKIKGTAAKTTGDFVKKKHPDRYDEWLDRLPQKSKDILTSTILYNLWYEVVDMVDEPTIAASEMFFNHDLEKCAWEIGRYSAEDSLSGIYRAFVRIASVSFLIKRSSRIMNTYYTDIQIESGEADGHKAYLYILKMEPNKIIEHRIGGWIETAFTLAGCKNLHVDITQAISMGNKMTEYRATYD